MSKIKKITPEEVLKYEIAKELGLLDRVMAGGWESLSSRETGKIGGLISKKRREDTEQAKKEPMDET